MSKSICFILNNREIRSELPPGSVLLDFIRSHERLIGTRSGCREGDCGACAVLVGSLEGGQLVYRSATACLMALGLAHGKHVVTVEGLNLADDLTPVQQALVDQGGSQCGFCTTGFVVSLTGYCLGCQKATLEGAMAALGGNICRCTGYKSIQRAAADVVQALEGITAAERMEELVERGFLPAYFTTISDRLEKMEGDQDPAPDKERPSREEHLPVGGGTDLYVQQPAEMVAVKPLFTAMAADLKTIARENGTCRVGSAATISDLMDSPVLGDIIPHMARFMALIASEPIRNLATVGGNIVNASPIGDPAIIFLALQGRVVLRSKTDERALPLKAFFKGYKELDLQPGELLAAVVFDLPAKRNEFYFNFEKVGKRRRLDIASVNSAIAVELDGGVIKKGALAAGGVAPVPLFLSGASACMVGKAPTAETVGEVATAALEEISPISDIRGSAAYKRLLLRQLIWAHFQRLFPSEIPMEELP